MPDWMPPEALLAAYPGPMASIANRLRTVVLDAVPESIERVRVGWRLIGYDVPVGRRSIYFAWISPEPIHVHLGFPRGILLDDPAGVLIGRGITKQARWFTFRKRDDLRVDLLAAYLRHAADLCRLPAAALHARRLDDEARDRP